MAVTSLIFLLATACTAAAMEKWGVPTCNTDTTNTTLLAFHIFPLYAVFFLISMTDSLRDIRKVYIGKPNLKCLWHVR